MEMCPGGRFRNYFWVLRAIGNLFVQLSPSRLVCLLLRADVNAATDSMLLCVLQAVVDVGVAIPAVCSVLSERLVVVSIPAVCSVLSERLVVVYIPAVCSVLSERLVVVSIPAVCSVLSERLGVDVAAIVAVDSLFLLRLLLVVGGVVYAGVRRYALQPVVHTDALGWVDSPSSKISSLHTEVSSHELSLAKIVVGTQFEGIDPS